MTTNREICAHCRLVDDKHAMIRCRECGDWFHTQCENISGRPIEVSPTPGLWKCTECRTMEPSTDGSEDDTENGVNAGQLSDAVSCAPMTNVDSLARPLSTRRQENSALDTQQRRDAVRRYILLRQHNIITWDSRITPSSNQFLRDADSACSNNNSQRQGRRP